MNSLNPSVILLFETNIHFWTNIPFQTISIRLETSELPVASYRNLQLVDGYVHIFRELDE